MGKILIKFHTFGYNKRIYHVNQICIKMKCFNKISYILSFQKKKKNQIKDILYLKIIIK